MSESQFDPETDAVVVYAFMTLDDGVESSTVAPFKATRDAIEREFGGQVLQGTGQTVHLDDVDAQGRYVRIPTGWGDLPAG